MPARTDVPSAVRDLARVLAEPRPMRRGTLTVRYLKCNKPGCPCAERDDARHGPYSSVVRSCMREAHEPTAEPSAIAYLSHAGQQKRGNHMPSASPSALPSRCWTFP